ncbi:MAG: glycosyltransferase family 2 protein [Candidatus Paceibacterota bacterium]
MGFENSQRTEEIKEMESEKIEEINELEQVREFIKKELPPTEKRIETPMHQECKVSVVIPVYAERKDIFSRTLLSFADQKDVDIDNFEVICVVNNSKETLGKIKKENKDSLSMLTYLQNGDENLLPSDITNKEKEILNKIRDSKINIFAIDKSTKEKAFSKELANVGGARERGLAESIARFLENQNKNGIIAHTDADTRLGSQYIASLLNAFDDESVVGVTGPIQMEQGEDYLNEKQKIDFTEMNKRFRTYWSKMQKLFPNSDFIRKNIKDIIGETNNEISFNGANMASRAFAAAKVGGIDKIAGEEDTTFGKKLSKVGKIIYAPEAIVYPKIRRSLRTTTGHGLRTDQMMKAFENNGDVIVENPLKIKFIEDSKKSINQLLAEKKLTEENFLEILKVDDEFLLNKKDVHILFEILKNNPNIENLPRENPAVANLSRYIEKALQKKFPQLTTHEALAQLDDKNNYET